MRRRLWLVLIPQKSYQKYVDNNVENTSVYICGDKKASIARGAGFSVQFEVGMCPTLSRWLWPMERL